MIQVTNLFKNHGPHRILDGVSLTVNAGEVTALVGPSGGGKSTLLRCINALEPFDAGELTVGDLTLTGGQPPDVNVQTALRRRVGMVFQQFNLFPHMTAIENIMCGPLHALGKSKSEARETAQTLLAQVGLAEKANSKPSALSGGQQQRVAIARALAVRPAAILLDEPTSALDPKMAAEVLAVLGDLALNGQTMIIVTHDMELASQARVVHRMVAGRISASGPASEVLLLR